MVAKTFLGIQFIVEILNWDIDFSTEYEKKKKKKKIQIAKNVLISELLSPCFFKKKVVGILLSRPSVHPSRYLVLNHWAEFYQTCYITSPQSKVVQE